MQLHELACSSLSLHEVTQACTQFLSLSEQLTRISQCFFLVSLSTHHPHKGVVDGLGADRSKDHCKLPRVLGVLKKSLKNQ